MENITDIETTEKPAFFEMLKENRGQFPVKQQVVIGIYIVFAVGLSLYHLYTAYFGMPEAWMHRATHVIGILMLAFLLPKKKEVDGADKYYIPWDNAFFALCTLALGLYIYIEYEAITDYRTGNPNMADQVACWTIVILTLVGVKKRVGWPITIVGIIFWAYIVLGDLIPGAIGHPRFSMRGITNYFFNTPMGIFGVPTSVSALYIILFIIFGSFLNYAKIGQFFIKLAYAMTGRWRGGPAKAAVAASALFGSIHGSAPGNVMATGVFTIPLMKQLGYPAHTAGAIEAVASTGGRYLPPIMGATAFLIAEFTGTPYVKIMAYGLIPAICYYIVLFIMVHLEAIKLDLGVPADVESIPRTRDVMKEGGYLIAPLIVMIVVLVMGYSVFRSAGAAIVSVILVSLIKPATRMKFKDYISALEKGATSATTIGLTCIAASIIVGSITMSGLGTKLATQIQALSGGSLPVALLLTAIVSIILGLGMPATPVYIILVATVVPALIKLGVGVIPAHFFIFYYGTIASITPPVALGSYAGAAIAGADSTKVSLTAMKLGVGGFLLPFMFVYNNSLLLMGTLTETIIAVATAFIGFTALAIGVSGFLRGPVPVWQRIALIVGSIMLIWKGLTTDMIGFLLIGIPVTLHLIKYRHVPRYRRNVPQTHEKQTHTT